MAALVARWVRFYTRDLPTPLARRRAGEIGADLHEHIAHERSHGTGELRIALAILSRMVRGLPADASWHRRHAAGRSLPRSLARVALVTALLLLIPFAAMQVTGEVAWGVFDFVLAGGLVGGTGLAYVLATSRALNAAYRAAVAVALASALVLVWLVGAVGVIGEDGDRADLMYGGVLAVGIAGTALARFRADGMARALVATALAQALVAAIALIAGKHEAPVTSAFELVGLNGLFVVLFAGSALLFRRGARGQPPADAAAAD